MSLELLKKRPSGAIRDQLQEHAASDRVREKLVSKTYYLKDAIPIAKEIESGA